MSIGFLSNKKEWTTSFTTTFSTSSTYTTTYNTSQSTTTTYNTSQSTTTTFNTSRSTSRNTSRSTTVNQSGPPNSGTIFWRYIANSNTPLPYNTHQVTWGPTYTSPNDTNWGGLTSFSSGGYTFYRGNQFANWGGFRYYNVSRSYSATTTFATSFTTTFSTSAATTTTFSTSHSTTTTFSTSNDTTTTFNTSKTTSRTTTFYA